MATIALAVLALSAFPAIAAKPLKVYILAGQSNMEGTAKVETFGCIGDDPATASMLKEMRGPDGKPRVCERVWIPYYAGHPDRGLLGEGFGKLTAGYGARENPKESGGMIGPEFTFGITMEKACDGPILIVKTVWGGKSLNTDFRPPSAGPYEFSEAQLEGLKKQGKDIAQVKADKAKATGRYYRLMIDHVKHVLADPNRYNPGGYDKYSDLLAHFIRDVRKEFNAPDMPFVIGVMGVGGPTKDYESPRYRGVHQNFRDAMAASTKLPEFKGNIAAVLTVLCWDKALAAIGAEFGKPRALAGQLRGGRLPGEVAASRYPIAYAIRKEYWDTDPKYRKMTKEEQEAYVNEYRAKLTTPEDQAMWKRGASNAGYHYLGCAKTFALIGRAFAEAVGEMEKK